MTARVSHLFVCVLAAVAVLFCPAVARADDFATRAALIDVPGVRVVLAAEGERLAPSRFSPEARYDINWGSAPDPIVARRLPPGFGGRVLVKTEAGDPAIVAKDGELVVALEPSGALLRWPYFNYMLYAAAADAAGQPALRYAEWPSSPMPQAGAKRFYLVGIAVLWAAFVVAFRVARRRGRADTNTAARFFASIDAARSSLKLEGEAAKEGGWNRAGFARPLAGFLTVIGTMSVMAGAYLVLQWVLSNEVQPFPEADGLYRTSFDALVVVALLFELGTNIAAVKFFAENRVAHPDKALSDVQFYVWWQFFQRLLQATILGGIAIGWLPYSKYALYAPFVGLFAVKGLPAIFPLGRMLTSALQRFDYQNVLDMAEQRVVVYVMPVPFVLAGRAWGAANPVYGEAFGAAVGLALGQLANYVAALALGLWALRRIGVPLGPLFLAQFGSETVKRQLTFGAKIAIASEPQFILRSVEALIIINYLRDFPTWHGVHGLLSGRLFMLFMFGSVFYQSAVPAVSEAFSAGKRTLTRYYVARFFQFAFLYHFTIFSLMMAVGPAFIHALGPQWERAGPYLLSAMAIGLFAPPVWLSDQLQQGAGRPMTLLVVMLIEQGARLGLFFLLVPRLQFAGILLATLAAYALKAIVAWLVNHFTIVRFRISLRAALLAPAAAAIVNYAAWKALLVAWAPSTTPGTLALLCVACGASFFVTFFACGLAGGFERTALEELAAAAEMATFARPIARALSRVAHVGARLSPLVSPALDITAGAHAEAAELDATAKAAAAALGR